MENDLDYNRIGREKTQPDQGTRPLTPNGPRGIQRGERVKWVKTPLTPWGKRNPVWFTRRPRTWMQFRDYLVTHRCLQPVPICG